MIICPYCDKDIEEHPTNSIHIDFFNCGDRNCPWCDGAINIYWEECYNGVDEWGYWVIDRGVT